MGNHALRRDLILVALSVLAAIVLVESSLLEGFVRATSEVRLLQIFLSGALFTSLFTIPLSVALLGELALIEPIWYVASVGALGALSGDLILFLFLRDRVRKNVAVLRTVKKWKRIFPLFRSRIFHWIIPFIGALIIASPLPDELGLALMGFSNIRLSLLVPISLSMNFLGIYLVGLAAHAL